MAQLDEMASPVSLQSGQRMMTWRRIHFWKKPAFYRGIVATIFILAGCCHLLFPRAYLKVMPPWIPAPGAMIIISGLFEIGGGLGILIASVRRWAAYGLLALLVPGFPVNIYMFLREWNKEAFSVYFILLGLRLPLQFIFGYWILRSIQSSKSRSRSVSV